MEDARLAAFLGHLRGGGAALRPVSVYCSVTKAIPMAQESIQYAPFQESHFVLTLLEINTEKALLSTLAGEQVEVDFWTGTWDASSVVKDLGKWARRNLGLRGRTEPGVFTQIIWKDQVLGLNQPLVVLLEDGQPDKEETMRVCTFCRASFRDAVWGSAPFTDRRGPFYFCYFCGDKPSWHHGWCCPQNPASHMYQGPTHADRTLNLMRDYWRMTQVD